MALLLKQLNPAISQYKDRRFNGSQQEFEECLHTSTTVYVGNLSFFTTEDQIYEVGGEQLIVGVRVAGARVAVIECVGVGRATCCTSAAAHVMARGLLVALCMWRAAICACRW